MHSKIQIKGKLYDVELRPLSGNAFTVSVPALEGCVTWGTSYDHALAMVHEAAELWLEEMEARL